jgi:hypothetical protein
MTRFPILIAFTVVVCTTSVVGQGRPDFSGKWTLIRAGDGDRAPGAFGDTFVATQYSASLIIDWTVLGPQGRGAPGKMIERPMHSAFIFDGTESNVSDIYVQAGHSHLQIVDTSAWEGQKLVVTTTWRGHAPARPTLKRIIWLDPNGTLIVEASKPSDGGGPWSTVRSRYRRVNGGPGSSVVLTAGPRPPS